VRSLRPGALALGLCLLACAATPGLPQPKPGAPERLLLVSVARLTADRLADMPVLSELAASGALAERVESVAPASAYPAHATLVTGAAPASHGAVANRRLGDHGVRASRYAHASQLKLDTLWQRALEAGQLVASLDWPSTLGSAIPLLLPDSAAPPRSVPWPEFLAADATPLLHDLALKNGADQLAARVPGPERDAVLGDVACDLLGADAPPHLVLLRLSQTAPAVEHHGAGSIEASLAFAAADQEISILLDCLARTDLLDTAALVVVGDHGVAPVHTEVHPNGVLASAGLLEVSGGGVARWSAIARSNDGSAFVYARDERDAVRARRALEAAGRESGAYRVVSADEMIRAQADAEAWFGLEAEPGFAFRDGVQGPLLEASTRLAVGGYLPQREAMDAVLVAWGRGFRSGIRIPGMRQTDVAPTLARLLSLRLEGAEGRALIGVLALEGPVAAPAVDGGADGAR
jgi:predicted AlkP superfamily pyrophosphatase or phosphodiesterase